MEKKTIGIFHFQRWKGTFVNPKIIWRFFSESLADSQNSPSSFSSIFSAISDAGRAFIGGGPAPNNEGRAGRQSKKKSGRLRKMPGLDVKKLRNIKRSGQFSDLVDIFQNGQRQGVMVLRSGSGLAFSSPRPPVASANQVVTTATDRSFFPPQKPSPFPFDRKIHKTMSEFSNSFSPIRQNQQLITNQQLSNPFTPSAPFSTSFPPSSTQNSFAFPNLNSNVNSVNINNGDNLSVLNNADLTNMVENFGLNTVAPNPEQLMIHVVNQQKLRTSNGPVEQTPFRPKKNKKKNNKKKNKEKVVQNAEELVTELRRQGKTALGPSLSFAGNTINDFRTGRQTNTDKVVVPGFPNGLPSGAPEGVKIALASAQRGNFSVWLQLYYIAKPLTFFWEQGHKMKNT